MAVFISVSTDPFEEVFESQGRRGNDPSLVRRPLRGIEIKKNTNASIRIVDAFDNEIPLLNSSAPPGEDANQAFSGSWSNFILTSVQETRSEKSQVVETFGEDYIFFFGERPRSLTFSAILMNTKDFNWKSEFWENYERYLRGTRCLELNARLYLSWDDVIVEGYLLSANVVANAETPYHLPLVLQMFVTNYAFTSTPGMPFIKDGAADGNGVFGEGIAPAPENAEDVRASVSRASGGSLRGYLAAAGEFQTIASRATANALQQVAGDRLIQNRATIAPAERGRPFYENRDEYLDQSAIEPAFDRAELNRVRLEMDLQTATRLEQEARRQLINLGLRLTDRRNSALLIGKNAFTSNAGYGSFGIRQAQGTLE